jgi:hypothetical protein
VVRNANARFLWKSRAEQADFDELVRDDGEWQKTVDDVEAKPAADNDPGEQRHVADHCAELPMGRTRVTVLVVSFGRFLRAPRGHLSQSWRPCIRRRLVGKPIAMDEAPVVAAAAEDGFEGITRIRRIACWATLPRITFVRR